MCEMTDSYVWHDSLICATWLTHVCDMTHYMCDTTDSYLWHDSLICVDWLICVTRLAHSCDVTHYMCDMTDSYVWHDPHMGVTWLTHSCDMTHSMRGTCRRKDAGAWSGLKTWWSHDYGRWELSGSVELSVRAELNVWWDACARWELYVCVEWSVCTVECVISWLWKVRV